MRFLNVAQRARISVQSCDVIGVPNCTRPAGNRATAPGPWHGRIWMANDKSAEQSLPPGMVLPHMIHGGPGRAGGGEELGGERGLAFYLQRVALQGFRGLLESRFHAQPTS